MSEPRISIIVPVYNAQKYLRKCIDSILSQTDADWELLLINDGSSDDSGLICDEYAAIDHRIHVFHKPNGGVSSARNLGIINANGEYLTFLDADDWLDQSTIRECKPYLTNYDIVCYSIKFVYSEDGTQSSVMPLTSYQGLEDYTLNVVGRNAILGVCVGFYKRQIFEDKNIQFSTKLISGEDWLVQCQIVMGAQNIAFINKPFYYYNKYNEVSCTHGFKYDVHYSNIKALSKIHKIALERYSKKDVSTRVALAKCDLIYDFVASKIVRGHRLSNKQISDYRSVADLTWKEIFIGARTVKHRILLLLYKSFIGKFMLKL